MKGDIEWRLFLFKLSLFKSIQKKTKKKLTAYFCTDVYTCTSMGLDDSLWRLNRIRLDFGVLEWNRIELWYMIGYLNVSFKISCNKN